MTVPDLTIPDSTQKSIFTPGGLFLVIGLLVGILFCFAIPYGAGFDEETHMARIFEISGLDLLPNTSNKAHDAALVPAEFFEFSYQRRYFQTPAFDQFDPNKYLRTINLQNFVPHRTSSIYPPLIFMPQALVAGAGWRLLDLPILPVIWLCRLAGLLVYVLGTYLAIRLLPFGKWVMAILALSPMALYQAATLNADGFTNVVSFVFIACVIRLAVNDSLAPRARQLLVLAGLCLLLGFAKQGAIAILPALVILPFWRFPSRKSLALLAAGVALAVVVAVGWSLWALPNSTFGADSNQSFTRAVSTVLANRADFIQVFIKGVFSSIPRYFREWIGVYGHWLGVVPAAIYWIYPLALLAAFLAEPRARQFSGRNRILALAAFLVAAGATAFLFYLLYYRPGGGEITGVQGRYLTPLTPLLYLPLAGLLAIPGRFARPARFVAAGAVVLTIALFSVGLVATYYSDCGKTWYTTEPCSQPIYKNIDKTNAPEVEVNAQSQVRQSFTSVCSPLESVEVYVKAVRAGQDSPLHVGLFDGSGKLLDESLIRPAAISPGKYLNVPLHALLGEPGQTFEIRLDGANMPPNQGIVLGTSTDKMYAAGNLSVAGALKSADLIFHYSCANPWARIGK